jgi:hypothetical protein
MKEPLQGTPLAGPPGVPAGRRQRQTRYGPDRKAFELRPERVKVVRRLFALALDGHGVGAIARKLNAEGVPTFYRGEVWGGSSIAHILHSRAVLGEYQPRLGRRRKRAKAGNAIPGYCPSIIEPDAWNAVQVAMRARERMTGPTATSLANLFTGILHDARDRCALMYRDHGGRVLPTLASYHAFRGRGTRVPFPYPIFEKAVLDSLREIDPAQLSGHNKARLRVESLKGQIEEVDRTLAQLQLALEGGGDIGDIPEVVAAVRNVRHKRAGLLEALQEAQAAVSGSSAAALGELQAAIEKPDQRRRLRARLRQLVPEMWAVFLRHGAQRIAVAQLFFADGAVRSLLPLAPTRSTPRGRGR